MTVWYETGQKNFEYSTQGESTYSEWYKNGQIRWMGTLYNNVENGKWIKWDENGQLVSERNYKDGECISGDC